MRRHAARPVRHRSDAQADLRRHAVDARCRRRDALLRLQRRLDGLRDGSDGRFRSARPSARLLRLHRGDRGARLFARARRAARDAERRVLQSRALLAARHPRHAVGEQLPRHLPRSRADVAEPVCARRAAPRPSAGDRSGDEVLRPRRARQRLPSLRAVDDVRRDRHARHPRGLQGDRDRPDQQDSACLRARVHRRRTGLQAERGAVSHVGARCLRRCADAGHAAHRLRPRVCRVRNHISSARRGDVGPRGRLAADADRGLGRFDGTRQPRRDRADQHQAHAGLLGDRAHGLHAARLHADSDRGQHLLGRQRLQLGAVLHRRLCLHDARRVRDHPAAVAARLRGRPDRGLQGARPAQPLVRGRDVALHVLARRRAADGRLLRQARGAAVDRDDESAGLHRARRDRGAAVAGRRLLLHPHRQGDVFRRAGGYGADRRRHRRARAALAERRGDRAVRHPARNEYVGMIHLHDLIREGIMN